MQHQRIAETESGGTDLAGAVAATDGDGAKTFHEVAIANSAAKCARRNRQGARTRANANGGADGQGLNNQCTRGIKIAGIRCGQRARRQAQAVSIERDGATVITDYPVTAVDGQRRACQCNAPAGGACAGRTGQGQAAVVGLHGGGRELDSVVRVHAACDAAAAAHQIDGVVPIRTHHRIFDVNTVTPAGPATAASDADRTSRARFKCRGEDV